MADQEPTQVDAGAAQEPTAGTATSPTAAAGTGGGDRVTLLESRLSGLEARLSESGRAKSTAEKERDAALQRLADYEAGRLKDDEASQSALKAAVDRAAAAETSAKLARIEARFPETYAVFADATANMTDEQLAAAEARFTGARPSDDPIEPPTPRNPSTPRPPATSTPAGDPDEKIETTRTRFRQQMAGLWPS